VRTLAHRSPEAHPIGPVATFVHRVRYRVRMDPSVCYCVRMVQSVDVLEGSSLDKPRGRLRRPVNLTLAAATVARARTVAELEGVKLCRLVDRVLAAYLDSLPPLPRPRPARRPAAVPTPAQLAKGLF